MKNALLSMTLGFFVFAFSAGAQAVETGEDQTLSKLNWESISQSLTPDAYSECYYECHPTHGDGTNEYDRCFNACLARHGR